MTEELDREDWSIEQLLELALDAREEEMHTALPGRVERYDASSQTASVTPLIRRAIARRGGGTARLQMPTIHAVPVAWPRAGDWFVHMPLSAGDTVLLIVCERDPARWRVTGELSDPIDSRLHHLSHAVAIPGVYPRTRELGDTPSDALVIGRDGGSTIRVRSDGEVHVAGSESLALAGNLDAHLSAISADLARLKTLLTSVTITFEPTYGSGPTGKSALDASNPIATSKAKGS